MAGRAGGEAGGSDVDQNAFDRIAKVLGGAASRRSGLRAALGAALGVAALDGAAGAKGRGRGAA